MQKFSSEPRQELIDKSSQKKKKEQNVEQIILPSDKMKEYHRLMENVSFQECDMSALTDQLFEKEKIRFRKQDEGEDHYLHIQEIQDSSAKCFSLLKVSLGPFKFTVNVFMQDRVSPTHNFAAKSNCPETAVFFTPKREAVKCFSFDNLTFSQTFGQALKEFCLLKIVSGLGCSPSLSSSLGFDLIISQGCVEFAMEECQPIKKYAQKMSESEKSKLWKHLSLLHKMKIVHMDIKPTNIMWSSTKGPVFTDYGFSKLLKATIGFKSFTRFFGTLNFCTPEMKKAFSLKSNGQYIDLYYNDAYGLQLSLEAISEQNNDNQNEVPFFDNFQEIIDNSYDEVKYYLEYCEILKIRFFMLTRNYGGLQNEETMKFMLRRPETFLGFIEECNFHSELERLYGLLMSRSRDPERKYTLQNMQVKRSKIFLKTPEHPQISAFLEAFTKESGQQHCVMEVHGMEVVFHSEAYDREQLMDETEIKAMPRSTYVRKFARAVDLRTAFTGLAEKEKIVTVFGSIFSKELSCIKIKTMYGGLERCWKFILERELTKPGNDFAFIIPCAIVNLIILDAFAVSELTDCFSKLMNIKGQCCQMGILIFRCHLAVDWFNFKITSKYSDTKIEVICLKVLQKMMLELMTRQEQREFIFILEQLRLSYLNVQKLKNKFLIFVEKSLSRMKFLNQDVIQQIVSYLVYETSSKYQIKIDFHEMKTLISLYEHCPSLFSSKNKISHIHTLLFSQLKFIGKQCLGPLIFTFDSFSNCIQFSEILLTFKLYFSYKEMQCQLEATIDFLIDLCKENKYKYSTDIISWLFSSRSINNYKKDAYQKMETKIKTIFNSSFLENITFPQNIFFNSINRFFEKSNFIVLTYFNLYQKGTPEYLLAISFQVKLENYWDKILCQQCKWKSFNWLQQLKVIKNIIEERLIQTLEYCFQMIDKISIIIPQKFQKSQNEALFVKLIYVTLDMGKEKFWVEMSPFRKKAYELIINKKIFEISFVDERREIFLAINNYIINEINDFNQFNLFQRETLKVIFSYPCKEFIRVYDFLIGQTIISNKEKIIEKTETIIVKCLSDQEWSAYSCLLLAYLVRLIELSNKNFRKGVLDICRNVNRVISQARYIALGHLLSYILLQTNLVLGREKRRKIIKYFKYLKPLFSLGMFLKNIRPKKSSREQNMTCFLFQKKLIRFYNNQFSNQTQK